jgi:hypothetical protein
MRYASERSGSSLVKDPHAECAKAAEHCRTPKRGRHSNRAPGACVLECGGAPPLSNLVISHRQGQNRLTTEIVGRYLLWGAHAPRVLAMAPSPSRTFPSQSIAARRRDAHARRVRSLDPLATLNARRRRHALTSRPFCGTPDRYSLLRGRLDEGSSIRPLRS